MPKKLAGMKVPKAVRKSRFLDSLIGSETGRKLLADALIAAAAAAAATLAGQSSTAAANGSGKRKRKGDTGASAAEALISAAAGSVAGFVGDTAKKLLPDGLTSKPKRSAKGSSEAAPASAGKARTKRAAKSGRKAQSGSVHGSAGSAEG
jgi:hypothetical protein